MVALGTAKRGGLKAFLICCLMLVWHGEACLSLRGEQREVIDAREILNQQSNIANCLTSSLEKGNVGLARSIINLYDSQYEHLFSSILEKELKRLKLMQEEIVQSESTCEPVIKWGQNESHIFLSMKMSHRWDSPPCLNTKKEQSRLTNNTFEFTNVCVVSHSKITFNFIAEFYEQVKDQEVVVSRDGVGVYSTIIQKESDKVWPYLSKDEKTYQIWSEISERHNAVHKQYQVLLKHIARAKKSKPVVFEETTEKEEEVKAEESNSSEPLQTNSQPQSDPVHSVPIESSPVQLQAVPQSPAPQSAQPPQLLQSPQVQNQDL